MLLVRMMDKWFVVGRGDIGGFGVASDFSWEALGGIGYEVKDWFALSVQYLALGVDYDNGAAPGAADFFSYNTIAHGPRLGFIFKF